MATPPPSHGRSVPLESPGVGSSFDDFLVTEGLLADCDTAARERITRWQQANPGAQAPTLRSLLAQCDHTLPPSVEEREWLDSPAVGRELI